MTLKSGTRSGPLAVRLSEREKKCERRERCSAMTSLGLFELPPSTTRWYFYIRENGGRERRKKREEGSHLKAPNHTT